jgi:hypothetical protein
MTRILLGQLCSNGDCLYATTIARQIKHDFPGCHLTWAIGSLCKRVIENNPDVDEVWEIPMSGWSDMERSWYSFEHEAWRQLSRGAYDQVFLTQISPNRFANYDGTVRPSIFRNYPKPITVPVETVIRLTDEETGRVVSWIAEQNINQYRYKVLVECSSKSGQSFMTPALAIEVANQVLKTEPETCFIFSTHEPLNLSDPRLIHGGALNLREVALLTNSVDAFLGCGSGVTVVATSGAAKPDLPNIQVLKRSTSVYASFKHDFEYFKKPNGHFIELTTGTPKTISDTILAVLQEGASEAGRRFGSKLPIEFDWYFELIDSALLQKLRYVDAARSLMTTAERYGWRRDLQRFGRSLILPFIDSDESAEFPHAAQDIARFKSEIDVAQQRRLADG